MILGKSEGESGEIAQWRHLIPVGSLNITRFKLFLKELSYRLGLTFIFFKSNTVIVIKTAAAMAIVISFYIFLNNTAT